MKNFLVFVICLLSLSLTSCTQYKIREANQAYENKNYSQVIAIIDGISKSAQSYETFKLKGDAYYNDNNYEDALRCYEIATQLNNSLIIENLVNLYFLKGDIRSSLLEIQKMELNNQELTEEERKIQYICLYRENKRDEAELILNNYLNQLSNVDVIKLRILSYENESIIVISMLTEMYETNDFTYLEQLIDMCYSYGTFNSNYLSLLNRIYSDDSVDVVLRAKCAFYISFIFDKINNESQSLYYKDLYNKITKSINVTIPDILWQ
jgi:tetratricopeptide (TPR) repeat protein